VTTGYRERERETDRQTDRKTDRDTGNTRQYNMAHTLCMLGN